MMARPGCRPNAKQELELFGVRITMTDPPGPSEALNPYASSVVLIEKLSDVGDVEWVFETVLPYHQLRALASEEDPRSRPPRRPGGRPRRRTPDVVQRIRELRSGPAPLKWALVGEQLEIPAETARRWARTPSGPNPPTG